MATGLEAGKKKSPPLPPVAPEPEPRALLRTPPPEVLVVEDDDTLYPILEFLVEEARPGCGVVWARTSAEAEAWLGAEPSRARFRLVIADLFIQGEKNGVDLWRKYAGADRSFLVISASAREKFDALVKGGDAPLFLRKPLDLGQCFETLKLMLANPGWY